MSNPVDSFTERQYITTHMPEMSVPGIFKHTPPGYEPTPPDSSGLDAYELYEVNRYLDGLIAPTLPDAISYVNDYNDYVNARDAYKFANHMARKTQYRIAYGDALIYNKSTTSQSATDTGEGDSPPAPAVYPRHDPEP